MRFSLAVAVVMLGVSVGGWAQQNNTFKVKTTHEKPPRSTVPVTKTATSPAAANAKAEQSAERQNIKVPKSGVKKTAPALKPVKDKPTPPINFSNSSGSKGTGRVQ